MDNVHIEVVSHNTQDNSPEDIAYLMEDVAAITATLARASKGGEIHTYIVELANAIDEAFMVIATAKIGQDEARAAVERQLTYEDAEAR